MNIKTARALMRENIQEMTLEKVQRHKVRLLDAWRESKADYGMDRAIKDGFYKILESSSASGFVPADMWLTHNLMEKYEEARKHELELLGINT
jgi:hypothetical protein